MSHNFLNKSFFYFVFNLIKKKNKSSKLLFIIDLLTILYNLAINLIWLVYLLIGN